MEVREQPVAVRPRVRRPRPLRGLGELRDAPAALDATGQDDVGLDDVDAAADDEIARLRGRSHHLAGRDAYPVVAQRRVAVDVVSRQRLLEPVDVERLELAGELGRGATIPARREVAGHAPALVRVDHDLELGTASRTASITGTSTRQSLE